MPQMGESIAEGTVSVWLKEIGDPVERDEPLMEISTDKVDAEIPSPAGGVLSEIVVVAGQTVEVGTVVAYIETEPGSTPAALSGSPESTLPQSAVGQVEDEAGSGASPAAPAEVADPGEPEVPVAATASMEMGGTVGGGATLEERLRAKSSPLVRRIAEENGIDLRSIPGTGRMGRVTKADILRFVATGGGAEEARDGDGRAAGAGSGGMAWSEFHSHVVHPEVSVGPGDRVEPMTRMTQLIAEHMVLSRRISPHVHSYFEIDYSRVDQVRARNRESWEAQGVKPSYTAFIARAVAAALREHPKVNASVSGDSVVYRGEVNLGIAVALPWGLIVPVVPRADELSLVGLARKIADLAARARAKKLSPEEVQGGTFTITNPGVFGTVIGFPIINQPQVAILGVGGIEKRPVVITDEYGNDAIVARKRGFISLGYDHRLVNGADGDRFLATIKEYLESFPDAV